MDEMDKFTVGQKVAFAPKNGGEFPTGEKVRTGTVETITDNELVVRQKEDGFARRISPSQVL